MKSCLISGATGLIGSDVVRQLQGSCTLFALTRKEAAPSKNGINWIYHDFSSPAAADSFPSAVDAVVHLAQSPNFRDFPGSAEEIFSVNVQSTLSLLEYARKAGAKNFVYASSGGIYLPSPSPAREDYPVSLRSDLGFYLSTKFCSELLAETYKPFMNIVILRFFFVYGPSQRPSMLIPRLIQNVRDGSPLTLQGPDGIRINPTYVADAAGAVIKSMDLSSSATINVGGPGVHTMREIGEIIGRTVGMRPVFQVQEGAAPADIIGDTAKMSRMLGSPRITLEEGIARMTR